MGALLSGESTSWIGVIPVRLHSTRVPTKALQRIGGLPLVAWCWRNACRVPQLQRVVVATDSDEIALVMQDEGAEVVRTGPHPSGTHRVAEAAMLGDLGQSGIVNLQGDLVDVDAASVMAAIEATEDADVGTVMVCGERCTGPEHVRVWHESYIATDFTRTGSGQGAHVGVYAFRPGVLQQAVQAVQTPRCREAQLEQLAWLDAGVRIGVRRVERAPMAIDTIAQLKALRARVNAGDLSVPAPVETVVYAETASR